MHSGSSKSIRQYPQYPSFCPWENDNKPTFRKLGLTLGIPRLSSPDPHTWPAFPPSDYGSYVLFPCMPAASPRPAARSTAAPCTPSCRTHCKTAKRAPAGPSTAYAPRVHGPTAVARVHAPAFLASTVRGTEGAPRAQSRECIKLFERCSAQWTWAATLHCWARYKRCWIVRRVSMGQRQCHRCFTII